MKKFRFIIAGGLVVILASSAAFVLVKFGARALQGGKASSEEALFKEAKALEASGSLIKAKEQYQNLIKEYPQGRFSSEAQKAVWDLNTRLLFSSIETADSKVYTVQPQDTLGKIAKRFGTTVELIMSSNNLKSDLIRPGMRLKISTAKYSLLVDKSQNALTLKSNDEICKVYQVATGIDNSTPTGTYKINVKLIDPTWYKAGAIVPAGSPKNILGTRWLGLTLQGYGIHGSTEPESIGKQITAGCIRMLNKDVEELYTILPVGTEVTIID